MLKKFKWTKLPATDLLSQTRLQADWNRLNAERGDLPFLDADAQSTALRIFGDGSELLLLAHEGDTCVAMVLLAGGSALRWQTFQPSQLPLGAWVAAQPLTPAALARSLSCSGALPLCLSVSFTQIDSRLAPQEPDTSTNRHTLYIDTAWVPIEGSFDDYWAARGKNLRQNMRKQRNRLQSEGIETRMAVTRAAADMPAAVARYGELEGRGWKAQRGTAITPDNAQGRFYSELLGSAAAKNEGTVYEYLFDGKVVASNLCLQRGGTLVILKTTYDESLQAYSPAFLLQQDMLQELFANQTVRRVEYYGRVMEWHTRWTDKQRPLYHLTTFRNGLLKRMVQARQKREAAKQPPAAEATGSPS